MNKKPKKADDFAALLADVKGRIQTSQTRAVLAVNAELVRLYWDIGRIIDQRQQREGWGAAVIPRLAAELKNELPELKGFSERNIDLMIRFYRAVPRPRQFRNRPLRNYPQPQFRHRLWRNWLSSQKCNRPLHNCQTRRFGPFRGRITSSSCRK